MEKQRPLHQHHKTDPNQQAKANPNLKSKPGGDEPSKPMPKTPLLTEQQKKPNPILLEPTKRKLKPVIWDCGSTLYDSFELNSFKRQLDSALSSARTYNDMSNNHLSFSSYSSSSLQLGATPTRTQSMPHLSHNRFPVTSLNPPPASPISTGTAATKKPSKLPRPFLKLLRSVFSRSKSNSTKEYYCKEAEYSYRGHEEKKGGGSGRWFLVYDDDVFHDKEQKKAIGGGMAALSTIPEFPVVGSPPEEEMIHGRRMSSSLVRKTTSDRFIRPSGSISLI